MDRAFFFKSLFSEFFSWLSTAALLFSSSSSRVWFDLDVCAFAPGNILAACLFPVVLHLPAICFEIPLCILFLDFFAGLRLHGFSLYLSFLKSACLFSSLLHLNFYYVFIFVSVVYTPCACRFEKLALCVCLLSNALYISSMLSTVYLLCSCS